MQHPQQKPNYKDPFSAGQMVGMLVMIEFTRKHNGIIPDEILRKLQTVSAQSVEEYFEKPTEDILLMIDKIVKEIDL